MATYYDIADAALAAGKPVTTQLATRLRDNPIALYENTVHGAATSSDQTNNTATLADVSDLDVDVPANSVWMLRYSLRKQDRHSQHNPVPPPLLYGLEGFVIKIYAASVAATPGYAMGIYPYWDTGTTQYYTKVAYAAINAELDMTGDMTSVTPEQNAGVSETLVVTAVFYAGSSDTTIHLAFRCHTVSGAQGQDCILYEGSSVLAQELSGSV